MLGGDLFTLLLARCHLEAALVWRGGAEVSLGSPRLPPQNVLPGLGTHGAGRGQALCPTAASVQPSRAIFAIIIWDYLFFSPNFAALGGCRCPYLGGFHPLGIKQTNSGCSSRRAAGLEVDCKTPPPQPQLEEKPFPAEPGLEANKGPFIPWQHRVPTGTQRRVPRLRPLPRAHFPFFCALLGLFLFFSPPSLAASHGCASCYLPPPPVQEGRWLC